MNQLIFKIYRYLKVISVLFFLLSICSWTVMFSTEWAFTHRPVVPDVKMGYTELVEVKNNIHYVSKFESEVLIWSKRGFYGGLAAVIILSFFYKRMDKVKDRL